LRHRQQKQHGIRDGGGEEKQKKLNIRKQKWKKLIKL
jgi:hypothetical protein